jgi:putative oxygen-independent coproporphyrinogen III oxidase
VSFGVYVHVPFCTVRCGYCDFTTYTPAEAAQLGTSTESWLRGVAAELDLLARTQGPGEPATSVFLGGGTPSLLSVEQVREVLARVRTAPGAEVTMECNPESVTPGSLAGYAAAGVNRISFGMQSAVPHVLAALQRRHDPSRVAEVVRWARDAGIARISVDLIYGAHTESAVDWRRSLEAVLCLEVDHVSAYALVVEDGTALGREVARGLVPRPDDDVLADRYLTLEEALSGAGFRWYEVSSWARTVEQECLHNRNYWADGDWWGIGPGAHSHVGDERWWNVKHPGTWSARLEQGRSPEADREHVVGDSRELERVMLGIRVREGLPLNGLATGTLVQDGLLEIVGDRAVLTLQGRLLADHVVRVLTS